MANKEKETKQKAGYNGNFLTKVTGYNLVGPKVITERSYESGIASQKENKLLKPKAEHFLSFTKREAKSKTNKSSNSAYKYNSTTVRNTIKTKAHSDSDPISETQGILDVSQKKYGLYLMKDLIRIIVKQNLHHVRISKLF